MTTVIFLEHATDVSALSKRLKELRLSGDIKIISVDNKIPPLLPALLAPPHAVHVRRDELVSDEMLYEENEKASAWFKRWSAKPLSCGKNFKELFTYRDVSLWWFCDFWFFHHELHHMTVKEITQAFAVIHEAAVRWRPERIISVDSGFVFGRVLERYCEEKRIPLERKQNLPVRMRIEGSLPPVIEWLKYRKYGFRKSASRILYSTKHIPRDPQVLLVGLTSHLERRKDPRTGEDVKVNIMYQSIIDLLEKKGVPHLHADIDFTRKLGIGKMVEQRRHGIPVEYFISDEAMAAARTHGKELQQRYLGAKEEIAASLVYEGVSFWPLLEDRFDFLFEKRIPEAIMWIETFLNLISTVNPKSVLIVDETGITGRAAIVAGRILGKNVVGLQHGTVCGHSFDYLHDKEEVSQDLDHHVPFCPLPHKTAIYGENTRKVLLEKGNYPAHSIALTGQPRYDVIRHLRDTLDKDEVCKGFGLDSAKKRILFITQPRRDRFLLAKDIFSVLSAHRDCEIILKPHPREHGYEEYVQLAKDFGLDMRIITTDLFKLLFVCDVVVQRDSAVGTEAMMFGKPLICAYFFYEGITQADQFFASGCRIARTLPELKDHLRDALDGSGNEEYIARQDAFVDKETFNSDGSATERVVKLLLDG